MPTVQKKPKSQLSIVVVGAVLLEAAFARMHHLNDLKQKVIEFMALALAAGVVYMVALYFIEHSRDDRAAFWVLLAAAVLFRLTLFPLEPSLSDDLHRYRWDGRVQAEGWNPYEVAPNDPRLALLRDSHWAAMPGRETPSIYPPVAQLLFRLAWKLLPGPTGFKTPFLLADLLILAMLAGWFRRAGERNFRVAIYAWNPLVIVEFAGSGHNDAIALAGVVAGLLIIKRRPVVSTMLLTAAALAKAFPAVLLPLALRKAGWPRWGRGWACAAAGAATAAACIAPYWNALGQLQANLTHYEATWRNYHASLYSVVDWFTGRPEIAAGLGVGIVWGLALWLAARRADSVRAAYLLFGAILLLAPNGYSWYFTWMVPLLCFFPNPVWLLLTVLQFLSYNVLIDYGINGRWHFDPFLQWLTYGPFYALLIAQALWRRRSSA
jgi:alpha-1,6-mannosyltransferase